jgi:hypothetical protein
MLGGKMPKTCWAVNKRQDNKLENCCIWLVIYLNKVVLCCTGTIKVLSLTDHIRISKVATDGHRTTVHCWKDQ